MNSNFIIKRDSDELYLLFAGWGMDERPFQSIVSEQADLCVCYDYTSLDLNLNLFRSYKRIYLMAWSMGVWAASQVLQKSELPICKAIAINGTKFPVDDQRGIPEAIFQGTLSGLNERNLLKFNRRMCGSAEVAARFNAVVPNRDIEALKLELSAIHHHYKNMPLSNFKWDQVIIANNDMIFPAQNQIKAWEGHSNTCLIDDAHYAESYLTALWTNV